MQEKKCKGKSYEQAGKNPIGFSYCPYVCDCLDFYNEGERK